MSGQRHTKETGSQNKCLREQCLLLRKKEKTGVRVIRWAGGEWSG